MHDWCSRKEECVGCHGPEYFDKLWPQARAHQKMGWGMLLNRVVAAFIAVCLVAVASPSDALDYPTGVVRIIVPYLPGGSAEAQARFLAAELQKQWGKPVIIENKPGAGTTIGAAFVATQKPDGYTLYLASTSHTVTPSLYKSLPYDPIKSFEPISMISSSPFVALVKGDSSFNSLVDLVKAVHAKPGTMSWASSGIGAGPYLSGQLFKTKSGLDVVHVPFTGTPPSLNAVIGGHVNYVFADITSLPLIRSGQLKTLAVTTPERSPLLPDVPTFAEQGIPGVEVSNWSSIIVPAGTPKEITAFINASIVQALTKPDIRASYERVGFVPQPSTPEEVTSFMKSEIQKYADVIHKAGITPN
jgi:tripartite-type tricarboxylate transporter receptor subunit TctC